MFAVDSEIKKACEHDNKFIISNYNPDNVGAVSYDLGIDYIISSGSKETTTEISLRPNEIVFVKTKEKIKIPNDYVGIVTEKNSVMREGLVVSAPYYQPGHETYCFLRVHNISSSDITISEDKRIAQIMFSKLAKVPDTPYSNNPKASFNDEEKYRGFGKYEKEYKREIREINKASESLEEKIQSVYPNVLVLMGIIAAIFSIITVNFNAYKEQLKLETVLSMNLSFIFAVSLLMGLIFTITNKAFKKKRYLIPYWIMVALTLAANIVILFIFKE